ncbi:uncharacterized protein LOC127256797 [Andrographis paniculata]|uniref:uncharacterized protein LOC127256797 n=1 Tax=Andrographis paniculata TaxID=175694 RepID=UPI0021E6E661|nr:uncharacterized protein LOC127256797 [Andrographis paniculata]
MATVLSLLSPSPTPFFSITISTPALPFSISRIQSQNYNHNPDNHHIKFSTNSYRITTRGSSQFMSEEEEEEEEDDESCSFDEAVMLFNMREYYKCHDVLEALWNKSPEPTRTLVHAILQVAVGLHHLFNQNHKGAMMQLGEGLCKLRKMNFEGGPFHRFEKEISSILEFIYHTQLEQAACTEEHCIAMDGSERSYQLLGGYAAGERIYHLELDNRWNAHIVFCPDKYEGTGTEPPSIKIPVLEASEQHILNLEYH